LAGQGAKVMDLPEAVAALVRPGASLSLGLALEGFIPFAAAHEIIRQRVPDLTLIGPISNICFDQMIGAGLVKEVIAAWLGNVSTGIGYNFSRALEEGRPRPLSVIHHSNFSLCLALEAGARGLPMGVSRSPLGSDIIKNNPHFKVVTCPHTGQTLLAVKAVNPDLAIVHVQRADAQGNCQAWGASGVTRQAALAANKVLVTCEEIVDSQVIRADPDRTLIPGILVAAVCQVPWGAHPAPMPGFYNLDNEFFVEYAKATRQSEDAQNWLDQWVYRVPGRPAYLEKLGKERLQGLGLSHHAPSPPVEYGW